MYCVPHADFPIDEIHELLREQEEGLADGLKRTDWQHRMVMALALAMVKIGKRHDDEDTRALEASEY